MHERICKTRAQTIVTRTKYVKHARKPSIRARKRKTCAQTIDTRMKTQSMSANYIYAHETKKTHTKRHLSSHVFQKRAQKQPLKTLNQKRRNGCSRFHRK